MCSTNRRDLPNPPIMQQPQQQRQPRNMGWKRQQQCSPAVVAPDHHNRVTSTSFEIKTLTAALPMKKTMALTHSLALASRSMPPASAFRHLASQSSTAAFQYWTGSSFFGARLSQHRQFNLFQYRTDQMPDSPAFRNLKHCTKGKKATPCTSVLQAVKRDTPCMSTLLTAELDTPCRSTLLIV